MKKLLTATAILMALLAAPFVTRAQAGDVTYFVASLDGSQEVPSVDTDATGEALFALYYITNENGELVPQLYYEFSLENIEGVTAGHIHKAPPGVSGPVIIPLDVNAMTGVVTPTDENIHDMLDGNTYINIHTRAHGNGEIRGQIMRLESE